MFLSPLLTARIGKRRMGFSTSTPPVSDGGGGDPGSPPEGMAFLFAENGEPILDQDGAQIYAEAAQ